VIIPLPEIARSQASAAV